MRPIARIMISALAALLLLSLTACKTTLEPTDDKGLYDKKNDISYVNAPTVYEAVALDEEYGTLKLNDVASFTLYTIPGMDPNLLLATEDHDIVRASTVTMPTLAEMQPTVVHVCVDGSETVHELFNITDPAGVADLVDAYMNSESLTYPGTTPQRTYRLRFESETYTGFYYTLTYVEYAEELEIDGVLCGRYFILRPSDKHFVPVSNVIHAALGVD